MARRICSPAWPVSSSTRLHLRPHLGHRQRYPYQQILPLDDLKLVIGLANLPLVFLSHGGSLLKKGFSTRTLSEFGREPLLSGRISAIRPLVDNHESFHEDSRLAGLIGAHGLSFVIGGTRV